MNPTYASTLNPFPPAPSSADGAFADLTLRIHNACNLLEQANDSMAFTRDRLVGSEPEGPSTLSVVPPQLPGAVGEALNACDRLQRACERASDLVGPFARL